MESNKSKQLNVLSSLSIWKLFIAFYQWNFSIKFQFLLFKQSSFISTSTTLKLNENSFESDSEAFISIFVLTNLSIFSFI